MPKFSVKICCLRFSDIRPRGVAFGSVAYSYTAVLDACVLYPAPLRDFLMELAAGGLFRAKWTEQIHDEWIRNLLKKRDDLTIEQLTRTKTLMNTAIPDCMIEGYEELIVGLQLPDEDDRHVLLRQFMPGAMLS
jgi:hypothetical protein